MIFGYPGKFYKDFRVASVEKSKEYRRLPERWPKKSRKTGFLPWKHKKRKIDPIITKTEVPYLGTSKTGTFRT
jgi:hypothetical protein